MILGYWIPKKSMDPKGREREPKVDLFLLEINNWFIPSTLGATLPRDNLPNFSDVIPGGRYSSSSGSTDSFITISPAWEWTYPADFRLVFQN